MRQSSFKTWAQAAIALVLGFAALAPAKPVQAVQTCAYIYDNPSYSDSYSTWLHSANLWAETFQYVNWWNDLQKADRVGQYTAWLQANSNRKLIFTVGMLPGNVTWNGGQPVFNPPGDGTSTFSDGANGVYNAHWTTLANNIKNSGVASQVIIRLGHEMNGNFYMWSATRDTSSGNADFKNYWKQVVNSIRAVLPNAQFIWNPMIGSQYVNSENLYPTGSDAAGRPWVNYLGLDVYDSAPFWNVAANGSTGTYYTNMANLSAADQNTARNNNWNDIVNGARCLTWWNNWRDTNAPGIPLCIPEWGCTDFGHGGGGDDPIYINNMSNWMNSHNYAFESYFDIDMSDGKHTIWSGPDGTWGNQFPNAQAAYKSDFGDTTITNYVQNGSFENGTTAWNLWVGNNAAASYTENGGHSGSRQYTHWSGSGPYELTLYQTMSLPNGNHNVSAWVKSGGGQATCRMEISGYGGSVIYYNIPAASMWTQIMVPNVNVTTGSLSVGFYSNASANQWVNIDDVVVDNGGPSNYILNGGFESGMTSWNLWVAAGTPTSCAYTENGGHSGTRQFANWSGSQSYQSTIYQSVNVPNGNHTITAWVKSSGGQANAQMLVRYYNGGAISTVNIPASPSTWTQISTTVNVTSGTLEVSFYSNASANQWVNIDDVVVN